MASRSLPPLSDRTLQLSPHIVQVQVLIRHGARTPYSQHNCWTGYDEVWDCNTTMLMAQHDGTGDGQTDWLFRKVYDALQPPATNILRGTCHVGQLLEEAILQETMNGEFLRAAYFGGGAGQAALQLFASPNYADRPYETSTRFRGDDEQRTLMSGQILVDALFDLERDAIVDWHTADYSMDPIYPNGNAEVCPRLDELIANAYADSEFQAKNKSFVLNDQLAAINANWDYLLDCVETSHCTDRLLPDLLADGAGDPRSNFNLVVEQAAWQVNFGFLFDGGAAAKLASAPLLADYKHYMRKAMDANSLVEFTASLSPSLLLYSAHDTTLIAFLSALSLWSENSTWPPYASMLVLEVHILGAGRPEGVSHAVRLLYNGEILTEQLPGCGRNNLTSLCSLYGIDEVCELCDANVLDAFIANFSTWDRTESCKAQTQKVQQKKSADQCIPTDKNRLTDVQWFFLLVLSSAICAAACPRAPFSSTSTPAPDSPSQSHRRCLRLLGFAEGAHSFSPLSEVQLDRDTSLNQSNSDLRSSE
eukprot:gb/GEZN01005163.1/.p1 GENE.gb/GEZN01005163.1/~~gb/GEZN01005163.1/.p1  ORF type:complete len:573 (+),score=55.64 gb/GEZN01005163.1/:120-1721(+)